MIFKHPLLRQAGRFMTTGLMATGIHATTVLLMMAQISPPPSQVLANGVAFLIANIFSYVVNSLWSFTVPLHGQRYLKFLSVSGIGFMGTLLVAYIAELLKLTPGQGVLLIVFVITPITFTLHKRWTFRDNHQRLTRQ